MILRHAPVGASLKMDILSQANRRGDTRRPPGLRPGRDEVLFGETD